MGATRPQEILNYRNEKTGARPYPEWLAGLNDPQTQNRIRVQVNRVRLGNFGHCSPVGKGVLELKMDFGPGYRVYLGRDGMDRTILLGGGDKSTQAADIESAQTAWADYRTP